MNSKKKKIIKKGFYNSTDDRFTKWTIEGRKMIIIDINIITTWGTRLVKVKKKKANTSTYEEKNKKLITKSIKLFYINFLFISCF